MILDARKDVGDGATIECDVCIVGSGPAGIPLALELAQQGLQVVILEAGGKRWSRENQDFFRGQVTGGYGNTLQDYRHRRLGGTSCVWGGRCFLFDPIDFEKRDYVPDSGWPVTRDEMLPYYERAHTWCHIGSMTYDASTALPDQVPEMIPGVLDDEVVMSALERWSLPTQFARDYSDPLRQSANLRVFINAACTDIDLNNDLETVSSLKVRTGGAKTFTAKARVFVLAAGGLEVPRLLLASSHQLPAGIGNHHDLVGRYFMEHCNGNISTAVLSVDSRKMNHGYYKDRESVYVRRRLNISEAAQRKYSIPNFGAGLGFPPPVDPDHGNAILSAIFFAKHIRRIGRRIPPSFNKPASKQIDEGYKLWLRHFRNILLGAPELSLFLPRFAYLHFLKKRRLPGIVLPTRNANFAIWYQTEQTPNRDSRVALSDELDQFGMRRIVMDFHCNEIDVTGIVKAHQLIDRHFRRNEIGYVQFHRDDVEADVREQFKPAGGHIMGTTRMADDPRHGVVDPNCRVFGTRNLFVASSAVFPTSSHANPTLTIVAMTVRLADHLRTVIGASDPERERAFAAAPADATMPTGPSGNGV
ncbi:MAG: GMC family oxidoreductase [Alphaproteobacteria bacterium]|nr:GMC family oxidoreductase [Alphaproteobacteria bacterium]